MKERKIKTPNDLISLITEFIKDNKFSISSIEDSLYFSHGLISRWKKGTFVPTLDRIIELLSFLKLELVLKYPSSELSLYNEALDLELLQQKIQKKLNTQLECDTSKMIANILFSDNISLEDKKKIHKMLNYLVVTEEMSKE